jgi:hypothetical protein
VITDEDREGFCDVIPATPETAWSVTAVAVTGIRHDLAAIVTELRELRYAVERAR